MDPNGIFGTSKPEPQRERGRTVGLTYVITYNDGRYEEYFRPSGGADDGSDDRVVSSGVDPTVRKQWDDANKPTRGAVTTADGQRVVVDPTTGQVISVLGAGTTKTPEQQAADAALAAQQKAEREFNAANPDEHGRAFYETNKEKQDRLAAEATAKTASENTAADNKRADAQLNIQLANLGISREKWEAEKGKPVQAGNGRWYQWDAASGALKDVTPTSGASPIKPLGPQPYGRLAEPLSRALQNVYNDATLTNEEKLSRAQVLVNEAKTMESEFTNQINATRGIYGDQVQQRGHTLTDVASRRALGDKSAQMGYDTAKNLLGSLDDPSQAGALMRMMIGLPGQQATALGGMRDVPEIQLPVAAQQVLATPLGGTPLPPGYGAMVQGQSPQGGFLGGMTQQPMAPSPQQDEYTRWLLSQGIPGAEQYVAR